MRALAPVGAALGLLALACGGEPTVLPVDGCPAGRLPEGATGLSLATHLEARPAWASDDSALVLATRQGPAPLPPLPSPLSWLGEPAAAPSPTLQDGLVLCEVQATVPTSWMHARLHLGGVEVRAATGTFAPEGTLWISLPVARAEAGDPVVVEAADLQSRTDVDPFFLLAAGVPLPRTRSAMQALGRVASRWDGAPTWSGADDRVQVRCAAWSRAEAEARLASTWSALQAGLDAMCRGTLELGWPRTQEDGVHMAMAEAAAVVGWADPRLRAAESQVERVRRGFAAATGGG